MKIFSYPISKLPSTLKLAITGAIIGPIVDGIHNQCLLEYHKGEVDLKLSFFDNECMFRSSLFIPPLLAMAYVIIGTVLPNAVDSIFLKQKPKDEKISNLKVRSILAVSSTALIIKLSEYLLTHNLTSSLSSLSTSESNLVIMMTFSFLQWLLLDRTAASLITGILVSIGGPLSELPFVANDFWTYVPGVADYMPLHDLDFIPLRHRELALSTITGPCYFAVTMDAIALSRLFKAESNE